MCAASSEQARKRVQQVQQPRDHWNAGEEAEVPTQCDTHSHKHMIDSRTQHLNTHIATRQRMDQSYLGHCPSGPQLEVCQRQTSCQHHRRVYVVLVQQDQWHLRT